MAATRNTAVYISKWKTSGAKEPDSQEEFNQAFRGLVIKFENDLWNDGVGAPASDLIARLVYRLENKTVRIDYGVWLNAGLRSHDIRLGETSELLIVVRCEPENEIHTLNTFEDRRAPNQYFGEAYAWFRPEVVDALQSVEITLTERLSQGRYVFDFAIRDRDGNFDVLLDRAEVPTQR